MTTDRPNHQQTISPFPEIMIGFESLLPYHFLIFQLREPRLRLNTASPYKSWGFESQDIPRYFGFDNFFSSVICMDFENRSKFGFSEPWSEASGDVWDGQG